MKYTVVGADRVSGTERRIEVNAADQEDAERIAGRQGMLVAEVLPMTVDGRPYEVDVQKQKKAQRALRKCENCDRVIGKLESMQQFSGHNVCLSCYSVLVGQSSETRFVVQGVHQPTPYRALGLETRGTARALFIVGLLLSPAIIGIPLIIWACVADSMLAKHERGEA